jgi:hypothetical protein
MKLGHFLIVAPLVVCLMGAQQPPPATQRVPGMPPRLPLPQPAAAGLPWPAGLGRNEAITGHIAAIDKDQIMVKSLDHGEVLFWVDERTVVRVDKFRLALSDLRIGDPVAVRLKNIKGRGPYASEILPHPDVRARKERGETGPAPPASTQPAIAPDAVSEVAIAAPLPARVLEPEPEPPLPSLPAGTKGVAGTVIAAAEDTIEVRDTNNQSQKVLVTSVTRIRAAGSETVLQAVNSGDRVAVIGDRLDDGQWIAREILVNRRATTMPAAVTASAPAASSTRPTQGVEVSPDGLARFSGTVASLGNEEIHVRTASGERTVLVTGITEVRRMGVRGTAASLKVGDQVSVVGDPLEGGLISAREVTVTKLAGS